MSTSHFNKLTEAEAERLAILAEECGETVQAVTKILRHGFESWNNKADLEREIGNILAIADLMISEGDVDEGEIHLSANNKVEALRHYTHHQAFSQSRPEEG